MYASNGSMVEDDFSDILCPQENINQVQNQDAKLILNCLNVLNSKLSDTQRMVNNLSQQVKCIENKLERISQIQPVRQASPVQLANNKAGHSRKGNFIKLKVSPTEYIMVNQDILDKVKKSLKPATFYQKLFTSFCKVPDLYNKNTSGRAAKFSKEVFSHDLEEKMIYACSQIFPNSTVDLKTELRNISKTKLCNFNRLFRLMRQEPYTEKLLEICKLSKDDIEMLEDFKEYSNNPRKLDELDSVEMSVSVEPQYMMKNTENSSFLS